MKKQIIMIFFCMIFLVACGKKGASEEQTQTTDTESAVIADDSAADEAIIEPQDEQEDTVLEVTDEAPSYVHWLNSQSTPGLGAGIYWNDDEVQRCDIFLNGVLFAEGMIMEYDALEDMRYDAGENTVELLYYFRDADKRQEGYQITTISKDHAQEAATYYVAEGETFQENGLAYELYIGSVLLTEEAIYFSGWPGVYRIDRESAAVEPWGASREEVTAQAGVTVTGNIYPTSACENLIFCTVQYGVQEEEHWMLLVYRKDGELLLCELIP